MKELCWEKQNWELRAKNPKNPSNFPTKNMLIYNSMHPKESIFYKFILFFRLSMYILAQWVESFSEETFLREKNENWEPRKDKNPSNFSQDAYKYIIYNSMHQHLLIFEKAILLFKVGAVLYLGEPQRLNSLLKEYSCFCSPLVSYIRKILNFIHSTLLLFIMHNDNENWWNFLSKPGCIKEVLHKKSFNSLII